MKKLNLRILPVLILMIVGAGLNAQNAIWQKVSSVNAEAYTLEQRNSIPEKYDLFKLNYPALRQALANAPERFSGQSNVIIELPVDGGKLQSFRVYEASNFEPGLQAKHPNIRSYAAQGIEDPTAIARFSTSEFGINVMISSGNFSTVYIDPYTQDKSHYISYNIENLPAYNDGFQCFVEEMVGPEAPLDTNFNANDGKLRTFRLALACTGEYATFHINRQGLPTTATDEEKKAAVLVAMNDAMTRVNGIYERDASLNMVIIENNEDIIFLNANTDPYTNNDGYAMLQQNQTTVDNIIGSANYDIGHVFSTGGGGIAQLRSPCQNGMKARGVTGLPQPVNDPFYVDYVSHEMGHQYGANHTFNNSCQGNRNAGTAMEPGSGSTILGYAGICPPNVQNRSDAYFHAISIQEIVANIRSGVSTCSEQTDTNNQAPTANAGGDKTIPKGTPFILQGSATDPDDPNGEALTYTWEQMNPQAATMPPQNTSNQGPAFRSKEPEAVPYRYMPMIQTVINGQTQNTWEVVPQVARTMNFRFTVRDNHPGGSATDHDNMRVTVDGNSGPFVVTSQNSATTWETNTPQTITWDVAGTDAAPVNCSNVDILFSTDGGLTYTVTLASGVPNNGSATVNAPNLNTTKGRVMVKGANNIFFNINSTNINVTGEIGVADFAFENFSVYPNPSNGTFNLKFTPESTDVVTVSLYDLRGRLINQNSYSDVSNSIFHSQLDYSAIGSGIYFLVVENGGKTATKKLVKN